MARPRSLLPAGLVPIAPVPNPRLPTSIVFQDELQEQYFRLFFEETARAFSNGWDSPFWQQTVLQACQDEPCILQCAVAVAALDKCCRSKDSKAIQDSAEAHHQYALQQYGKALRGIQEVTNRGENSTRTVLIASLLIYSFENFHGDTRLGLKNIQSALALMHDFLANTPRSGHTFGWSPAPDVIEDELVAMFAHLDVVVMNWSDRDEPLGTILKYTSTTITPMPTAFANIVQANDRFDHIVTRAFHYMAVGWETLNFPKTAQGKLFNENGVRYSNPPVLDEIYSWQAVFDPILKYSRTPAGESIFVRAAILRLNSVMLSITVQAAFFNRLKPELYDMFLQEHYEIVSIATAIVSHQGFLKTFVFDKGILPALFMVMTTARDRLLRQEAVRVLKEAIPRREGVWDSLTVARIGEELLKLEAGTSLENMREWINAHLQRSNDTYDWNETAGGGESSDPVPKYGGRPYLLDWVERCMKLLDMEEAHNEADNDRLMEE